MAKVFEDEFMEWHASIIGLCEELAEGRVDTIYTYCCMERAEKMIDVFFVKNGKVLTVRELKIPISTQSLFMDLGLEDMSHIEEVCKRYGRPSPTEIKMVFDTRTRSLETSYRYKEYLDAEGKCAEDIYEEWIAQIDPGYRIF